MNFWRSATKFGKEIVRSDITRVFISVGNDTLEIVRSDTTSVFISVGNDTLEIIEGNGFL
jgi:hypothetical protein